MIFGYLLLALVPVAAIAYIIWDHRRKVAARNAESAGRLHELLSVTAQPQHDHGAASSAEATAPPAALRAEPPPSAPLYATRDRLLTPPQTLLYYLLRTGLPDHVVFARMTLASILEAGPGLSGFAREEQLRRLAALTVDFVVSDKNMQPVAVVELAAHGPGSAAQADRDSARTRLVAAGVRYVELDPKQLPRKDAMRAVVLGDTPAV